MTSGRVARDLTVSVVLLPLTLASVALAALPGSFTPGGTRRWGRGRSEESRARAQQAKDSAATAFYELDTAQRDLRITLETLSAAEESPESRRAAARFATLGEQVDRISHDYISTLDAHDLDAEQLDAGEANRAYRELSRVTDELVRARGDLTRFEQSLTPLVSRAQEQLAQVVPAVDRAKAALLAATEALDGARRSGLSADELAARLAGLGPELRALNEGAGQHGVRPTIQRAERVLREARAIAAEAARLPERAAEIDRRLTSLRTRAEAISHRAESVGPVLSELRRRFMANCWQDLQRVPEQAEEAVREAGEALAAARAERAAQRFDAATGQLSRAHELLGGADEAVSAAGDRLRRLTEIARDASGEVERARFAVRDAQRLAMRGRTVPDPRHAGPLDAAVARLERAVAELEEGGRNPDYWRFLTELEAVRESAASVVEAIRAGR
ncbi:hypothetical protein RM844_10750 [Streptomyces sp. DSM 44915]|uniref:Chromosome partition protein Smc n=1 Tax=Streptomyces chisholmiae TaxID=3075540 RepID=A0ABU2JP52_9ACTN|nr:hypothetical protein [Streptomyces sp. DSM 44915]MDT0266771.1 hypothetical protein [Streptomyces sp. DSM 44915]